MKQCEAALQRVGVLVAQADLDDMLRSSGAAKPYSRSGELRVETDRMLHALQVWCARCMCVSVSVSVSVSAQFLPSCTA